MKLVALSLSLVHSVLALGCSCGKFSLCRTFSAAPKFHPLFYSLRFFASSSSSPSSPSHFSHHLPSFLKVSILAVLSTILCFSNTRSRQFFRPLNNVFSFLFVFFLIPTLSLSLSLTRQTGSRHVLRRWLRRWLRWLARRRLRKF